MKLYGSLTNRMIEGSGPETVEIGMGATRVMYSDRYPYTVIEVLSPCRIKVQEDFAKMKAGGTVLSESQDWEYFPDPNGDVETLIKTKRGWKVLGREQRFAVGFREKFYDPTF